MSVPLPNPMIPPAPSVAELLRTPVDQLIARGRDDRPRLRDADDNEINWTVQHPLDRERNVED